MTGLSKDGKRLIWSYIREIFLYVHFGSWHQNCKSSSEHSSFCTNVRESSTMQCGQKITGFHNGHNQIFSNGKTTPKLNLSVLDDSSVLTFSLFAETVWPTLIEEKYCGSVSHAITCVWTYYLWWHISCGWETLWHTELLVFTITLHQVYWHMSS